MNMGPGGISMSESKKKPTKRSAPKASDDAAGGSDESVSAAVPTPTAAEIEAAKRKYVQGIIARGEAVPKGSPLTGGATHEIEGYEPDGTPILKRRRFSSH
jgi:hypothetical protein